MSSVVENIAGGATGEFCRRGNHAQAAARPGRGGDAAGIPRVLYSGVMNMPRRRVS